MEGIVPIVLTVSLFLPFYFSVVTVSAVAIITMLDYSRRAKAFESPYTKLLLSSMVGSFFVAAVYNNYWGMGYSLLLMAVVISGLYLKSIMTRQLFHQILDLACASSVLSAVVAYVQKFYMYGIQPEYRPVSTFTNANYYGAMIEFVVLAAVYRMITNPKDRKFYGAIIGLNLIGLYLSASMSACFALICGLLVMLFFKKKYKLMTLLLVFSVAFAALSLFVPELFPRVEAIDHTFGQRLSIWQTAIKGIEQHPLLGQGPTAYRIICAELNGYVTFHCHNLLLDSLLNFGFIGTGAISIYILAQCRLLYLRFRNRICTNMNILMLAVFASVMVHGLTDVTIFWIQTGALFMIIFSCTGINASYLERRLYVPGVTLLDSYITFGLRTAYLKNS